MLSSGTGRTRVGPKPSLHIRPHFRRDLRAFWLFHRPVYEGTMSLHLRPTSGCLTDLWRHNPLALGAESPETPQSWRDGARFSCPCPSGPCATPCLAWPPHTCWLPRWTRRSARLWSGWPTCTPVLGQNLVWGQLWFVPGTNLAKDSPTRRMLPSSLSPGQNDIYRQTLRSSLNTAHQCTGLCRV